ncbi:unnamed protein product [Soboliphyme baturini]|uniref:C2H2-type domain-containing protein n=1 Tax=Soboliphyme baturini TaxID=241478 RepID=A0A183IV85_9BILA|nr:unnamed protein product [Soboliphyme baturini]
MTPVARANATNPARNTTKDTDGSSKLNVKGRCASSDNSQAWSEHGVTPKASIDDSAKSVRSRALRRTAYKERDISSEELGPPLQVVEVESPQEMFIASLLKANRMCDIREKRCVVPWCMRSFSRFEILAYHLSYAHQELLPPGHQTCSLCGKVALGLKSLSNHLRSRHRMVEERYNNELIKQCCGEEDDRNKNGLRLTRNMPDLKALFNSKKRLSNRPAPKNDRLISTIKMNGMQDNVFSKSSESEVMTHSTVKNAKTTTTTDSDAATTADQLRPSVVRNDANKPPSVNNVLVMSPSFRVDDSDKESCQKDFANSTPRCQVATVTNDDLNSTTPRMSQPSVSPTKNFSLPRMTPSRSEKPVSTLYHLPISDTNTAAMDRPSLKRPNSFCDDSAVRDHSQDRGTNTTTTETSCEPPSKRLEKYFQSNKTRNRTKARLDWNSWRKAIQDLANTDSEDMNEHQIDSETSVQSRLIHDASVNEEQSRERERGVQVFIYNGEEESLNTCSGFQGGRTKSPVKNRKTEADAKSESNSKTETAEDVRSAFHAFLWKSKVTTSWKRIDPEDMDKLPVVFNGVQYKEFLKIADLENHQCLLCHSKFTSEGDTGRHCCSHLNFVRFYCHLCNAAFFSPSDVAQHLMNHCTRVKPNDLKRPQVLLNIMPCCEEVPGKVASLDGYSKTQPCTSNLNAVIRDSSPAGERCSSIEETRGHSESATAHQQDGGESRNLESVKPAYSLASFNDWTENGSPAAVVGLEVYVHSSLPVRCRRRRK